MGSIIRGFIWDIAGMDIKQLSSKEAVNEQNSS